jgi:hypothetical protein
MTLTVSNHQQQLQPRATGGKHKSITSETSLLGHEEAGDDNDTRRRCKAVVASLPAERCRLLADTSTTTTTTPNSLTPTPTSRYDSDSGAESRYSGDDHDYAWVEGGASTSGGSREEATGGHAEVRSPKRPTHLDTSGRAPQRPKHLAGVGHRPNMPPLPQGYKTDWPKLAHTLPVKTLQQDGDPRSGAPRDVRERDMRNGGTDLSASHVAYAGSEEPTLPRRPLGGNMRGYPLASDLDPYTSNSMPRFAHPAPPSPAPPPSRKGGGCEEEVEMARVPSHQTRPPPSLAVTYAGEGSGSGEAIYNPPWESTGLAPLVAVNRPLSLRTLHQLPQHFFDSSPTINEGPTTEL